MITPRPALVKPRARSPETNEVVLLEDLIELCAGEVKVIEILGGPKSGKSTALAHLASLPIAERLVLVDDPTLGAAGIHAPDRLVVIAARQRLNLGEAICELAGWSQDDLVEYLLAAHPAHCASVSKRFLADADRRLLEGKPELYCVIADQMAVRDTAADLRTALRLAVAERAGEKALLQEAQFYATAALLNEEQLAENIGRRMTESGGGRGLFDLLAYRWVQVLLAADRIAAALRENDGRGAFPRRRLPRDQVKETAYVAASDPIALERLQNLVDHGPAECAPMAASILHAVDRSWLPRTHQSVHLQGAYLSKASWPGLVLRRANFARADLRRADLRDANLEEARLTRAKLQGGNLEGANLVNVVAGRTNFTNARMARARLALGRFVDASFAGAVLDEVSAERAKFQGSDFRGASLVSANLAHGHFRDANFEGADLQDANFRGANLSKQKLREANLLGADFSDAVLFDCDLEYVDLPGARFAGADLTGAWLTGSTMPGGNFRGARLKEAGLADVDWEDADLRGADLRGCSFHLGSTRSGLVGSPYPCHGTRTGFYTNDYDEQSYKAPEEIRKANLCGADLRGARIDDVDFYLVDLRGARYDAKQAEHFRRCDAILYSRAR